MLLVSTLYYIQVPEGAHLSNHFSPWNPPPLRPWQRPIPSSSQDPIWDSRAEAVKTMYLHAYHGYLKHAMGHDELLPLSNKGTNK